MEYDIYEYEYLVDNSLVCDSTELIDWEDYNDVEEER